MKMDFLQIFSSPTGNFVGLVVGIIGVIVAVYFHRRGQRLKKPCWTIKTNNLIQDYSSELSKLRVLYEKEEVEDISTSKIIFWNEGKETINSDDIPKAAPLKIEAKNNAILLETDVLQSNNKANRFSVIPEDDKRSVQLSFDYLDHGNGAVIQVIHTGTTSDDLKLTGDIKGVKTIEKKVPEIRTAKTTLDLVINVIGCLMFLTLSGLLIHGRVIEVVAEGVIKIDSIFFTIIILMFFGYIIIKAMQSSITQRRLIKLPQGLEAFKE